jgi:hypothetical protein
MFFTFLDKQLFYKEKDADDGDVWHGEGGIVSLGKEKLFIILKNVIF